MRKYAELCPPDAAPELRFDLPELRYPDRLNAPAAVLEAAAAAGWSGRAAFYEDGREITFGDVRRETLRHAAALRSLGIGAGDVVILRLPDTFDLVALVLAVQAVGAVALPTYVQLRAADLAYRAEDSGSRMLVSSAGLLDEALAAAEARGGALRLVALPRDPEGRCESFADHLPAGEAPPDYADTDAEELCLLIYTSGSSGAPKGTSHCHRDMLAVGDTYWRHGVSPRLDDIVAGPPSIAFALGFGLFVYFPLQFGHAAVLDPDKSPERALETIARRRVTIFAGVSSYYGALAALAAGGGADLSSLRHAMAGGEPLTEEVERAWNQASGAPLEQFIGTSELLHCFLTSTRPDGRPDPATLGRVVPGWEVAALDPETLVPVADGEPGLLAAKGPTGAVYWNKPEEQAKVARNGWNVFQDLVTRDRRGNFRYLARHDEMIVSAGHNIPPTQVEDVLLRHPAVSECACVPAPDPAGRRAAIVRAHVVPAAGAAPGDALRAELQQHVKRSAPPYMYPREVVFEAALPRTVNGKIRRSALRGKTL